MIVMIAQLILCFSIIVVLHEFGHFSAAKWFKTKVEKFYLFFNPGFSLFKKKIGDTEYGIGWIPLGGYVKIAGMIDESMDVDQMKEEPKEWEFRSKPAWQRIIIMAGGVIVNFILGSFILGMMLWYYGEQYLPSDQVSYGVHADSLAQQLGFRDGDKILRLNDQEFREFNIAELKKGMLFHDPATVTVERNGVETKIALDRSKVGKLTSYRGSFIIPRLPFIVDTVANEDTPAYRAGLKRGDKIIGVNEHSTPFFADYNKEVTNKNGQRISLQVVRNKDTLQQTIELDSMGKLGVYPYGPEHYFKFKTRKYGLLSAMPKGVSRAINVIKEQIQGFKLLFSGVGDVKESLMGPVGISKLFGNEWIWQRFWHLTAFLSLIIGFVNLLPIPGLDGGYILMVLIEMVTGKKPSDKFMERVVTFGFIILMSLFVMVTCNDISRLF